MRQSRLPRCLWERGSLLFVKIDAADSLKGGNSGLLLEREVCLGCLVCLAVPKLLGRGELGTDVSWCVNYCVN